MAGKYLVHLGDTPHVRAGLWKRIRSSKLFRTATVLAGLSLSLYGGYTGLEIEEYNHINSEIKKAYVQGRYLDAAVKVDEQRKNLEDQLFNVMWVPDDSEQYDQVDYALEALHTFNLTHDEEVKLRLMIEEVLYSGDEKIIRLANYVGDPEVSPDPGQNLEKLLKQIKQAISATHTELTDMDEAYILKVISTGYKTGGGYEHQAEQKLFSAGVLNQPIKDSDIKSDLIQMSKSLTEEMLIVNDEEERNSVKLDIILYRTMEINERMGNIDKYLKFLKGYQWNLE